MISITTILLFLVTFLTVLVVFYGFVFFAISFSPWSKDVPQDVEPSGSISVLVPSHHEGEGVLNVIESLIQQDYSDRVELLVLMNDTSDSSVPFLEGQYGLDIEDGARRVDCEVSPNRLLSLIFTGHAPKREKLNAVRSDIHTEYVAIIDADHRAKDDWLRLSIGLLSASGVAAVQGRRAPLALKRIAQLWDSAQNHIGNESLCSLLRRFGLPVFFTGTTCVWKGEIYKRYAFGDCITEDTYLSYELLLDGHHIAHIPETGSREEVAPTLASYIRRRRRWSSGHTKTFFHFFRRIFRSPVRLALKFELLVHGAFYLVPVMVFFLVMAMALHMHLQLTAALKLIVLLSSVIFTLLTNYLLAGRFLRVNPGDIVVTFFWLMSLLTLAMPVLLYFQESELFFALLEFPYQTTFVFFHGFCIVAPLVGLIFASFRVKVIHLGQLFLYALSYPLIMFLDILACVYGFVDCLLGNRVWYPVERTFEEEEYESRRSASSYRFAGRAGLSLISFLFVFILVNDLGVTRSCGEIKVLIFDPIFFTSTGEVDWDLRFKKAMNDKGELSIRAVSQISGKLPQGLVVSHQMGEQRLVHGEDVSQVTLRAQPGWERLTIHSQLQGFGFLCKRENVITSTAVEIDDTRLLVNGEPFLVKGVIPSFSNAYTNLSSEVGFRQIKDLGANALRMYHEVPDSTVDVAEKNHLIMLDQPTNSNWRRRKVKYKYDRNRLKKSFGKLYKKAVQQPFRLFPMFGNELELYDHKKSVKPLFNLMQSLVDLEEEDYDLFGYATYSTYIRYPAPILGINMLDSGRVYWDEALDLLARYEKPIFASELGGFVAFSERTPESLRIYRLIEQWTGIMSRSFLGGVIYESHDNWAQPVPSGYNDPTINEQPDDERGIWDRDNKPKPILKIVRDAFNDIKISFLRRDAAGRWKILLKNKRRYTLSQIRTPSSPKLLGGPIDLAPYEERVFEGISFSQDHADINFHYTTHAGLKGQSTLPLPSLEKPTILNADFILRKDATGVFEGELMHAHKAQIILPAAWQSAVINGRKVENPHQSLSYSLDPAVVEVYDLEYRKKGGVWSRWDPLKFGDGSYEIRFRLPKTLASNSFLIMDGLGARAIGISCDGQAAEAKKTGTGYREIYIPAQELCAREKGSLIQISFERAKTIYVRKKYHPFGEEIGIYPGVPWVYSPRLLSITR